MRERLIKLLSQMEFDYYEECSFVAEDGYKSAPDLAEFFADHLLANGVIVPPCKVGDIVKAGGVLYKVYSVMYQDRDDYKKPNWRFHASPLSNDLDTDDIYFWLEEIEEGTVCVCTREEAEQALEKRKGGD